MDFFKRLFLRSYFKKVPPPPPPHPPLVFAMDADQLRALRKQIEKESAKNLKAGLAELRDALEPVVEEAGTAIVVADGSGPTGDALGQSSDTISNINFRIWNILNIGYHMSFT